MTCAQPQRPAGSLRIHGAGRVPASGGRVASRSWSWPFRN